ncbi:MAG: peptide chain release factor N(5)-glutamine methyltransferase [Fretibacterium sp.]|nr:peptide chain release factor N(5)-glutamine methyltransferase [Fretibacterium sp.]
MKTSSSARLSLWEARAIVRRELSGLPIRNATQEADLILRHVLSCSQAELLAYPERELSSDAVRLLLSLSSRRAKREPLQYLLGYEEFFGYRYEVAPGALIPRPETELLVELTLELLPQESFTFLDWGTGSGCIGATLLLKRPQARGFLVEKNPLSLRLAWRNMKKYGLMSRGLLLHSHTPQDVPVRCECDLVISNPPYIPTGLLETLMPEVHYEPPLALDGGEDGLDFYRLLFERAPLWLRPGGLLLFELGDAGQARILEDSSPKAFTFLRKALDFSAIPRCMVWKFEG